MKKICCRCHVEKQLEEFNIAKSKKDGRQGYCRECQHKAWNQSSTPEFREKRNAEHRENYEPEKETARSLKYYYDHREQQVAFYHSEEYHKRAELRYKKEISTPGGLEKKRLVARECRKNYPASAKAKDHKRLARKKQVVGAWTKDQWISLVNYYAPDNKCLCCGKSSQLTADHVIPLSIGGNNTITNIQPICKSCNSKKCNKSCADYRPDGGAFTRGLL